eukprot:c7108_g1_i1.p1 GENE.c7108_g1_i1~~c7108_g1_i1.p1  ORF type:complete len:244 (-),score=28.77 c7108_g1_i1:121-852(-)
MPGFLSPGSRDLIHRMLRVEPCERISVEQVFQHPWFQHMLPRYLAMNPDDVSRLMRAVVPEVVQEVVQRKRCDQQQLISSIESGVRDELTVFYFLAKEQRLKQNRAKLFPEDFYAVASPLPNHPSEHHFYGPNYKSVVSSCLPPHAILYAAYHALKELQFMWKLFGPYHLKCRPIDGYQGPFKNLKVAVYLYKFPHEHSTTTSTTSFALQSESQTYGLDFQRLEGRILVYLDFISHLVHLLEI